MNGYPSKRSKESGFGPLVSIGGLLCIATALVTGFEYSNHPAEDAMAMDEYSAAQPPPLALHRLIDANLADATPEPSNPRKITTRPFHGKYRGISIEGTQKANYEMDLQRKDNHVSGMLRTPYGKTGKIEGHVTGNTFFYRWMMGKNSGKGLALHEQGTLRGTWGYGNSAQNGGRSLLHLEI